MNEGSILKFSLGIGLGAWALPVSISETFALIVRRVLHLILHFLLYLSSTVNEMFWANAAASETARMDLFQWQSDSLVLRYVSGQIHHFLNV